MAAFAKFGSDLDVSTQNLLARGARLTELLKQPQYSPLTVEEQVVSIYAGTRGYLDKIAVSDIGRFESELLARMHSAHQSILDAIKSTKALSKELEAELKSAIESFAKTFA